MRAALVVMACVAGCGPGAVARHTAVQSSAVAKMSRCGAFRIAEIPLGDYPRRFVVSPDEPSTSVYSDRWYSAAPMERRLRPGAPPMRVGIVPRVPLRVGEADTTVRLMVQPRPAVVPCGADGVLGHDVLSGCVLVPTPGGGTLSCASGRDADAVGAAYVATLPLERPALLIEDRVTDARGDVTILRVTDDHVLERQLISVNGPSSRATVHLGPHLFAGAESAAADCAWMGAAARRSPTSAHGADHEVTAPPRATDHIDLESPDAARVAAWVVNEIASRAFADPPPEDCDVDDVDGARSYPPFEVTRPTLRTSVFTTRRYSLVLSRPDGSRLPLCPCATSDARCSVTSWREAPGTYRVSAIDAAARSVADVDIPVRGDEVLVSVGLSLPHQSASGAPTLMVEVTRAAPPGVTLEPTRDPEYPTAPEDLMFRNGSAVDVGLTVEGNVLMGTLLRRRSDGGWDGPTGTGIMTCGADLRWPTVAAGQSATFRPGVPEDLKAGDYRFVVWFDMAGGARNPTLRETWVVVRDFRAP